MLPSRIASRPSDVGFGPETVYVNALATSGTGTAADPWVIEETELDDDDTTYIWPNGHYSFASTIDVLGDSTQHLAENTHLHFTGSGPAIRAANATFWCDGFAFDNFDIDCTGASRPTIGTASSVTLNGSGSGSVTATVSLTGHGLSAGDVVDILGANQGDYNGSRVVNTVPDADSFTYQVKAGSTATSPATGTITIRRSSVAMYCRGIARSRISNLRTGNCSVGLVMMSCVGITLPNYHCTKFAQSGEAWTVTPIHGLLTIVDPRNGIDWNTCCTFENFAAEGVSDWGIVLFDAGGFRFSTTSEVNGGGVMIGNGSTGFSGGGTYDNIFDGFDIEGNGSTLGGVYIYGNGTTFRQCLINDAITVEGGWMNAFIGGRVNSVTVGNQCNRTRFEGVRMVSGNFTDNSTTTIVIGCFNSDGSTVAQKLDASKLAGTTPGAAGLALLDDATVAAARTTLGIGPATLTDAATVALDASLGDVFKLTAAGDRTIGAPTNPADGKKIVIAHTASGAGRTLALTTGSSGAFRFGADVTGLSATAAGKTDYIGCIYRSADSRWDVVAYAKGY